MTCSVYTVVYRLRSKAYCKVISLQLIQINGKKKEAKWHTGSFTIGSYGHSMRHVRSYQLHSAIEETKVSYIPMDGPMVTWLGSDRSRRHTWDLVPRVSPILEPLRGSWLSRGWEGARRAILSLWSLVWTRCFPNDSRPFCVLLQITWAHYEKSLLSLQLY